MIDYVERPVWSMSAGELLDTLDRLAVDLARLQTARLKMIAAADEMGLAAELGAGDLAELLAVRHRLDRAEARRDVRLARALPKYQAVSAALDGPNESGEGDWVFRPAQAEAIVSVLERLPATVAVEDLEVAERELVGLGRRFSPSELRVAAKRAANVLDTDGPEPDEKAAYRRESLVLARVANGVKFRGYLANDNAELFYSLIHAAARPRKTGDGEPDPRPRDKRQADALSAVLTIAATAADTGSASAVPGSARRRMSPSRSTWPICNPPPPPPTPRGKPCTATTCRPRPSGGWPATRRSSPWSSARTQNHWTWAGSNGS